jgi:NADH-quinone oxidoreductase subunit F
MDKSTDLIRAIARLSYFYKHESCGQCTPCREGSLWMSKVTTRMLNGDVKPTDATQLVGIADHIAGRTVCAFGEACSWPTQSFLAKFKEEFSAKSSKPLPPPMPPEYTRDELVAHDSIPAVAAPRGNGHEIMAPAATR